MSRKLRELKNKGQLQKVKLFPELKWYHKLWNKVVVGIVVVKDSIKLFLSNKK